MKELFTGFHDVSKQKKAGIIHHAIQHMKSEENYRAVFTDLEDYKLNAGHKECKHLVEGFAHLTSLFYI